MRQISSRLMVPENRVVVVRWPRGAGLRGVLGVGVVALVSLAACDAARPELAAAVGRVASAEGAALDRALWGLLAAGPATLPFIEAALHRGPDHERFNLVVALRRLALVESVPLLAHVASFDRDAKVAREAWETLMVWSSAATPRGIAAKKGLRKVDELRGEVFDAPTAASVATRMYLPMVIPSEPAAIATPQAASFAAPPPALDAALSDRPADR